MGFFLRFYFWHLFDILLAAGLVGGVLWWFGFL